MSSENVATEIRLLQALRFKGRAAPSDIAAASGLDDAVVQELLAGFTEAGHCQEGNGRLRLTNPGRDELDAWIAVERTGVDQEALTAAYHEFDGHNRAFKQLVTDWQLKDGSTPNDHADAAYDAAIVERLGELHARFLPLAEHVAAIASRLAHYPARFVAAVEKVRGGDHTWLARPLIESYHTVWFELHEDLIGLLGRSRVVEAAAGRAL